jgi:hypothetical protein
MYALIHFSTVFSSSYWFCLAFIMPSSYYLAMQQPPDPREDEDDGEEGNGMNPTPPLDQTLNDGEPVGRRGRGMGLMYHISYIQTAMDLDFLK